MTGVGAWRTLMGPVDRTQSLTVLGGATLAAGVVARRTVRCRRDWLPAAVVGAVALDLCGGLIAFQLGPVRRRYATAGPAGRLAFAAVHVQPYALPLVGEGSWRRALLRHAAAVGAGSLLEGVPLLQRRRRLAANVIAAAVAAVDVATTDGPQRWFGPVYALKVIGGHGSLVSVR